ncbi:MAG: DUF21 domain-containing protein [Clostridiaceae bacterium]|nr:DUF21 domain-containing protein [Clostridiaceae bacterium]
MLKYIVLIIMVIMKAILSASDTAFTYINKIKVSQESKKNKKALKIKNMIEQNQRFYGIIEVGITMIELLASAYAAEAFVTPFSKYLVTSIGLDEKIAIVLAICLVTIVLSYFLLIFGSVLPKRIAKNNPEKTAYSLINILNILAILNYPFEKLITFSTKILCKIFRIKPRDKEVLSEKEIKMMIIEGKDQGIVDKIEKDILFNALKFNDIKVKKVMKQKEEIDFINIEEDIFDVLKNIKKYKYTRVPIFEKNKDNIIGIFNVKDIAIKLADDTKLNIKIKDILRPAMFVSEEQKLPYAFKEMQKNKQAMMIVKDKDDNVVGLITMEDIIERLVGNIFDEYDN